MPRILTDELSGQAYKKVKAMILSKKLLPGQKIVQDKLAEELGISRTPLRSALQILEAESLVESIPRRGMIVKEFSNEEIIEIYDCRIALESTAVRLFTEKATTSDIIKLKTIFQPFLKEKKTIDPIAYKKADIQFHNTIIKKCGNSFLYKLFQQGNLLTLIDIIGLVRPSNETLSEHMNIIDAIEKRNSILAEKCIRIHLEKSKKLLKNSLDKKEITKKSQH